MVLSVNKAELMMAAAQSMALAVCCFFVIIHSSNQCLVASHLVLQDGTKFIENEAKTCVLV